jgi:hypothetical protein
MLSIPSSVYFKLLAPLRLRNDALLASAQTSENAVKRKSNFGELTFHALG